VSTGRLLPLLLTGALLLTGCTQEDGSDDPPRTATSASSSASDGAGEPAPSASERLGLDTGWGPSRTQLDRAARQARAMALPDLAGQVVLARWTGGTVPPTRLVSDLHLGGLVVFDENVASAPGLRSAARGLERAAGRPLLLAVDQEGGLVERIRGEVTSLPAFMAAGAAGEPALTRAAHAAVGRELAWTGIDVDLAPDTDVTAGPRDPVIGSRSAGSDPGTVARQGVAAARGLRDAGVLPVVKHFPGHGSLTVDSHLALPVQPRPVAQLEGTDLVPFRAAVEAGLPAVMIGHIAVRDLDPDVPATVSRPVVTGLLREGLGFDGLVVSDALEMAALRGVPRPAVGFLRAGGDVVLMPADPAATVRSIVGAVREGALPLRRLHQAAARVLAVQAWQRPRAAAPGTAARAVRRLADAATTSVAGPCRGRLVQRAVPLGDTGAVAAFSAAARAAGLQLGQVRSVRPPRPEPTGDRRRDRARLQAWRTAEPRRFVDGTAVHLLGPGDPAPDTGVVVATDRPYVLGTSRARTRLATYGAGRASMAALVAVLLGRQRAPGQLPVPVAGVPRQGC